MLHTARQLPAWLIFDVGRNTSMRTLATLINVGFSVWMLVILFTERGSDRWIVLLIVLACVINIFALGIPGGPGKGYFASRRRRMILEEQRKALEEQKKIEELSKNYG